MANSPITAKFIKNTSNKTGKEFEALQFYIKTPVGVYSSPLVFPTQLEKGLLKSALGYSQNEGDTLPNDEGFLDYE